MPRNQEDTNVPDKCSHSQTNGSTGVSRSLVINNPQHKPGSSTGLRRYSGDVGAIESSYQKSLGVSKGLPKGQKTHGCAVISTLKSTLPMIQMLSKSHKDPLTSIWYWLPDGFPSMSALNHQQYKCWTVIRPMHTVHQLYIPPTNIKWSHLCSNSPILYNFKGLLPREVLACTKYHTLLVFL